MSQDIYDLNIEGLDSDEWIRLKREKEAREEEGIRRSEDEAEARELEKARAKKTQKTPRVFDLSPKKSRRDSWLIFDNVISEIVRAWAREYPQAIEEAISKIGIFAQVKTFPIMGSAPYLFLVSGKLIRSRDVPRAAAIAFQTLAVIQKDREEG